ncbi:hsp70 family protein [Vibrio sp. Of7-15]|uniref:Hsp70 family protein n=1 Tax=Vibrio sp. Of7-15 TaxID=2724879 RepID=UPI001EF18B83|nr:Hsp70 family protein [Vibrio sp. Of7-15]MCG7498780.1 hsp70 family protein [Vibrio sp. Of7-15]
MSSSSSPRFLIGIDLGTTHTVVAYSDISQGKNIEHSPVSIFEIDQLIGPGEVLRKPLLPSFRYHPTEGQVADSDLILPWDSQPVEGDIPQAIIGDWARELGAKVEGRQVVSAKSWLSHTGVDRNSDILPWAATEGVEKVSPVIASASYLNHVRQAWNYHHPDALLQDQEVVVTVPASFDEGARALTLEAAKLAGLPKVLLLEEPQAVCYDWYSNNQQQAKELLKEIPLLMVCDVGGGTTDLSLIKASYDDQDQLSLERIGVGDHLMLGGDNLDLALAHLAEQRLSGSKKLSASALTKLIQQTRKAKERLLAEDAPETSKITMLGSGSKLIGGTKSVEITREEVHAIALDGFFPKTEFSEHPNQRQSAVVEFGLPYAADPAISKHLAQFIDTHGSVCRDALGFEENDPRPAIPAGVLLNGGVFNSPLLSQRALENFSHWKGDNVTNLENPHPDLSVAYGAVAYGKARHGAQLKIGGGSARSFFLVLEDKKKEAQGLCLLAKGTEEGQEIRLKGREFALTLGEPVRFNLMSSTDDKYSQTGALIDLKGANVLPLPPFIATLEGETAREALHANQKDRVNVTLACQLTEVGTLKVECVSLDDETKRWNVEFEIRKDLARLENTGQDSTLAQSHLPAKLPNAIQAISSVYGSTNKDTGSKAVKTITKDLEKMLGKRENWETPALRELATAFLEGKKRRRRSDTHERNWLKLTGYTLRPGFGYPSDEWRMDQVWPLYQQGIQFKTIQSWSDWWTFWRRISGGLDQDRQEAILTDLAKYLHPSALRNNKILQESQERNYDGMVRLAASLEHLDVEDKTLLAGWCFSRLKKPQHAQAHWWAIGRICSRTPFYGSAHNQIPPEQVAHWLPQLLEQDWKKEPIIGFAAVMMTRMTGDRTLDVNDSVREQVIAKLKSSRSPESWVELVSTVKELTESETKRVFGDALPAGLRLLN